ncbi:RNA polymerase sigma factor [Caulobacter sp. UNC279MFTsu5.1]|uniref:RNA polymerase sigma factor n=1 Tax=Caulobacter sp. UNC279MFTsu5.1 TaxID=1502775 RepID=UPI0008E6C94F|nr:sigma-70 family RNA polymerase sigma factor [Caulobacter sp. UNC279MFTsu5.1]SFJ98211.1 RNA polymerase sigma-70 factor, ECF subfamily [Caulobacter sp. UNC279MFTsu5.1]
MGVLTFPSRASAEGDSPVRTSDAAEPQPALDAPRFDALVARYRRPLLSFFQRRSVGAEDAEDLTQEVFMRLSRRFSRLHWGNPDGLVFTVAANALVDHERHERSRRRDRHVEVDPGLPDEGPSAEAALAGRERLRGLVAALDTLSPSVRAAFVLCRFENLTQAETAARLGLSVSAVEKHMMTALARLRLAIGTEHDA